MLYKSIIILRKALMKLPLGVCFFLGKAIGRFFYINGKKRRVAFRNIKSAFPNESGKEVRAILKKSFMNFGLTVIETLIAPRIFKYLTVEEEEKTYPGGGVFVGIHAGSWEVAISYWGQKYDFAVLAQEQKHRDLDKFLNELRAEGKIKVCFSAKELIRCLKDDYMVGVVIDHGAETDALEIEFFSHIVPTPKGAVYLARKFNKKIYPTFCHRKDGFFNVLEIGSGIEPQGKTDKELLTRLNKIYEHYLEKYPWEYFWYYKRFKRKTNRDVAVLSDAKLGHLKQSKALLSFLDGQGYQIKSKVIEVRFKNRFKRLIADILAWLLPKNCLSVGKILPILVDEDTWGQLDKFQADIVVSTGSSVAPLNKLVSSYLGAKSITILRPNIPLRSFDLAVIPEHDRIQAENAVMIKGALFCAEGIEQKAKKCKEFFKLSENKKLSLFLGGPLADEKDFMKNLRVFIPKLKEFALKEDYKILASTSRRTPQETEEYLEEELYKFKNTEALVIANRNNYDFVFDGFGVLADIVFVSSESISMVSEIASLQRPCICYSLEAEDDKRKIFLQSLKDEVTLLNKPYEIGNFSYKTSSIFEYNKTMVKDALRRLL